MARLDLIGGAYFSRSVIANAQRCINLFPERNRKDAAAQITHYQRPGLRLLAAAPALAGGGNRPGRGIWRASNGDGYCCIGQVIYAIAADWSLTALGNLDADGAILVSAADNGIDMVVGDGSQFGYQITLKNQANPALKYNVMTRINDPTQIFAGTIKWDYLDTFLLWALPNSQQFGSTLSNEVTFDPTYTAAKTGYPDLLKTIYVNKREIFLLGNVKTEIWYDAGNPLFPFAVLPGAYVEHGCIAPYSVASADTSVFWLSQDLQGVGLVLQQRSYNTSLISNHAISFAIRKIIAAGADISDAIAYTYTQDGHVFYVLTFISGDQTWVFDESMKDPELAWAQRGWTDANGVLHRERIQSHAFINGTNVGIDWENGAIYALDPDYYFDDVAGLACPIQYTRTFPQMLVADGPSGPMLIDGQGVQLQKFTLDFEGGCGPINPNGLSAQVSLRWSGDRGKTYGNAVLQSTGVPGKYETQPMWESLGLYRYPVFEISYSSAGPAAVNSAWVKAKVATQ